MSRTVDAKLVLNIEDKDLPTHITNVAKARKEWEDLGTAFDAFLGGPFKNIAAALTGLADPLKKIGDATKGGAGMGKFVTAVTDLASPLSTVTNRIGPFVTAMDRGGPAIERMATETLKWAKSMQTLSAVMNTLTGRLDSLMTAQQKADQNMANFGLGLTAANTLLKTQGQEMLRVLQAYAGFTKAVGLGEEGLKRKTKAARGFLDSLKYLERAYIRHSSVLFIAQHQIEGIIDSFVEAGQKADLDVVLGRSLKNFQQTMEDTREATHGMVTDLKIMKSAALMSSFNIPMENFASNMGMIQKLAIRTGQSTEYLMDSFARGVSRLSPAILDNLGLQISLKSAYDAFGASVGKATSELTAQEKKTAVLNEVLRQAQQLTSEVDPTASLSSRLEQSRATIGNFFSDMKVSILDFLSRVSAKDEELAATGSAFLDVFIKQLKEVKGITEDQAGKFREYVLSMSTGARLAAADMYGDGGFWTELNKVMNANDPLVETTVEGVERLRKAFSQYAEVSGAASKQTEAYQESLLHIQRLSENLARSAPDSPQAALYQRMIDEARATADFQKQYLTDLSVTMQRLEEMKKTAGDVAKQMFPDSPQIQAVFTTRILDAVNATKQQIVSTAKTGFFMDVLLPPGWEATIKTFSQKAAEVSASLAAKATQAQRDRLDLLDREVVTLQHLVGEGKGITSAEIDLLNLRKEASAALAEYNKEMERLGEAEASEEKVRAAGARLKDLLAQQAALEGQVKLHKEFSDALVNTAGLSKSLVADMVADGKTRNELEREFLTLRVDLIKATSDLALAQIGFSQAIGEGNLLQAATTALEIGMAGARLEKLKQDIIDNAAARSSLPKGPGPRQDRRTGDKSDDSLLFFQEEKDVLDVREDALGTHLSIVRTLWESAYDQIQGKTLATYYLEQEFLDKTLDKVKEGTGDIGFGLHGMTFAESEKAIEFNEKIIEALDALKEKYPKVGAEIDLYAQKYKDATKEAREHIRAVEDLASAFNKLGVGITNAFEGGEGLLGGDFLAIMDGLADSSTRMGEALKSEAVGYGLVTGAMPAVRAFSKELIDSRRKQATVEMLMNAAAAWAAVPNWPQVATHGTAAFIYGLVSGGAIKLPTKSSKTDKDSAEREVRSSSPINVYLYGTEFITSEGQMGQKIEDGIQQARAEGRI